PRERGRRDVELPTPPGGGRVESEGCGAHARQSTSRCRPRRAVSLVRGIARCQNGKGGRMADASADPHVFSRGSTVLDYWLVHAEGLTVQPLGVRVEEVVVAPRVGRAKALIVRSRVTRRRRAIPADAIAAVEPSSGRLLLDPPAPREPRRLPRPSPERVATVRTAAATGGRTVRLHAAAASRSTRAGAAASLVWLRPRAARAVAHAAHAGRLGATRAREGASWLAPRIAAALRAAAAAAGRLAHAAAAAVARAAGSAAERARAALEAHRARRSLDAED